MFRLVWLQPGADNFAQSSKLAEIMTTAILLLTT
jgi:hypothetical protein